MRNSDYGKTDSPVHSALSKSRRFPASMGRGVAPRPAGGLHSMALHVRRRMEFVARAQPPLWDMLLAPYNARRMRCGYGCMTRLAGDTTQPP